MSNRVGIGVVGAGSIGIRGALQHLCLDDIQDRCYLAAVCDPVAGRADAAAAKYGVQRGYESYDDLLADPAVDAVTLCSPIGLHFEQGLAAVRATVKTNNRMPVQFICNQCRLVRTIFLYCV